MRIFTYLIQLLRQLIVTKAGVVYTPRKNSNTDDIATMTAKTRAPTTVAEGGGLGGYLKSRAIAFRNLMTQAIDSAIGVAMAIGQQARAKTPGEQVAAA